MYLRVIIVDHRDGTIAVDKYFDYPANQRLDPKAGWARLAPLGYELGPAGRSRRDAYPYNVKVFLSSNRVGIGRGGSQTYAGRARRVAPD